MQVKSSILPFDLHNATICHLDILSGRFTQVVLYTKWLYRISHTRLIKVIQWTCCCLSKSHLKEYRGSYKSAHVLMNLISFATSLINSIIHKHEIKNRIFGEKTSRFCDLLRDLIINVNTLHVHYLSVNNYWFINLLQGVISLPDPTSCDKINYLRVFSSPDS